MTDAGCTVAPAVRHIDGTTRPQVVRRGESSLMQRILTAMEQAGIPPVLVNTSFNRQGQPIINTAEHALETFLVMDLDFLLLDEVLLSKRGHTKGSHTTFRTPPAPQFL
jgi:carbamoyltransferase